MMLKINVCLLLICLSLSTAAFGQKVWPKLNLQKGAKYSSNITATNKVVQTINGLPLEITSTIKSTTTFTVIAVTDTLYQIQVQYDSLALYIQLPDAALAFDAGKATQKDVISTMLAGLRGKAFGITLSKTGYIQHIDSIEHIIKRLSDSLATIPADQREQAAAQVTEAFGTAQFKATMAATMQVYPQAPVTKTGVWEINNIAEGRIKTQRHTLYSIQRATQQAYVIQGSAMLNSIETDTARLNGMPVKYRLSGLGNATLKVDKLTGWTGSATITQSLKGNAEILHNPKLPGGMLIPITVTGSISVSNK